MTINPYHLSSPIRADDPPRLPAIPRGPLRLPVCRPSSPHARPALTRARLRQRRRQRRPDGDGGHGLSPAAAGMMTPSSSSDDVIIAAGTERHRRSFVDIERSLRKMTRAPPSPVKLHVTKPMCLTDPRGQRARRREPARGRAVGCHRVPTARADRAGRALSYSWYSCLRLRGASERGRRGEQLGRLPAMAASLDNDGVITCQRWWPPWSGPRPPPRTARRRGGPEEAVLQIQLGFEVSDIMLLHTDLKLAI